VGSGDGGRDAAHRNLQLTREAASRQADCHEAFVRSMDDTTVVAPDLTLGLAHHAQGPTVRWGLVVNVPPKVAVVADGQGNPPEVETFTV
jgi:hypothetical protein